MKFLNLLIIVFWLPSCSSASTFSDQLSKSNEEVVLSFYLEKDKKTVSICKEKSGKYLVFRYGTKDKLDLEYPESLDESSWKKFSFYPDVIPEPGGKESGNFELTLNTWKYSYSIYENRNSNSLDLSLVIKEVTQENIYGTKLSVFSGTANGATGSLKLLTDGKYINNHPLSLMTFSNTDELIGNRISKPALVKNRKWKAITYYEAVFERGKEVWEKKHSYEFSPAGKVLKDEEIEDEEDDGFTRGSWRQEFETIHFDNKGRLSETKHFESGPESDSIFMYSEIYGYNDKGQMITTSTKDAEGKVTLTYTVSYNEQGNDIEYIDHFNKIRWTRTYDTYGRKLTNKEFRNLNKLVKVDSSVYSYMNNQQIIELYQKELVKDKLQTTGYSKYISDSLGKFLSGHSQYGYEGEQKNISDTKVKYNSLGLLEQKSSFRPSETKTENRTQYFYNDKNDLIKEITYSGSKPMGGKKWVYIYY